jgi:hypothetical protein
VYRGFSWHTGQGKCATASLPTHTNCNCGACEGALRRIVAGSFRKNCPRRLSVGNGARQTGQQWLANGWMLLEIQLIMCPTGRPDTVSGTHSFVCRTHTHIHLLLWGKLKNEIHFHTHAHRDTLRGVGVWLIEKGGRSMAQKNNSETVMKYTWNIRMHV